MGLFANDCQGGNPYSHDEYKVAESIQEHIKNKDFEAIKNETKKPIFNFLEIEIVKALKLFL